MATGREGIHFPACLRSRAGVALRYWCVLYQTDALTPAVPWQVAAAHPVLGHTSVAEAGVAGVDATGAVCAAGS